MQLPNLVKWLTQSASGVQFAEMLPVFLRALPPEVDFESDTWDLIQWMRRRGNRKSANIFFGNYQNAELSHLVKIYILYKRETRKVDRGVAELAARSMLALDATLGQSRSALTLNNEDFTNAQSWLEQKFALGTVFRSSLALQDFGSWLSDFLNLRVTYRSNLKSPSYHGRKGPQKGREGKLLHIEVIRDLVAAWSRDDLILKDQFFLSALCLDIACGFRINELTTLPVNCLIEEEGQTGIRFFPEKTGKLGVRWIPNSMVPMVKKCVEFIRETTEPGREVARISQSDIGYRWREILLDEEATKYFSAKLAHEWTNSPVNRLFGNKGAWYEKGRCYIDVIKVVEKNNGNVSAAGRALGLDRNTLYKLINDQNAIEAGRLPEIAVGGKRTSWDTDSRVLSMDRFIKLVGVYIHEPRRVWLRPIIEDAQKYQLMGKVYPHPLKNNTYEKKYLFSGHTPLIVDKDGKPVLEAKDGLFVILKYTFSNKRGTKASEINYVEDSHFSEWLNGMKRSHGTGNEEDSSLRRLGIIDSGTGEPAKFVWHDLRHWLNTMYQKGGLSEDMIALIFGRKASSNHIYDQTDMNTRVSRLQDSIRKGKVFGHLATTYARLAEHSREDAEKYLAARTIMINPMPHGLCSNNWSAMPCPHHLGCFSGNHEKSDGVCEHLEVEPDDTRSIEEIKRINRESAIAAEVIPEQSPQHAHYVRVEKNTHDLLRQLTKVQEGH